ncbi:MAG: ABC transporter ATP-binding protein [Nitrospirae bacterium CG_4_9_14_3_um_filter_53_35]|nr:MAG: ABC transporter ATP-binding protein [Nitrospirae bacterium CG2_30_53_67]PIS36966.1 MAG: ABC transporter ATP-binding protein [Nitrospirae bacterium CG08_land_8_20_14_0_20_52_24]PIV83133.1 MAG: ABC transporter ATP-binding protein [Nitrospirae bacterium CG17_big_fil_post_rev_8_21_14_2_50_50_9]PIW85741.1 MAG: ABC transporter ATP-binding protein [Nitrospirae bacterium CG_4_8_14_3_um_filter_50_41]PIX85767.1 MAG: ABC transporter ATP-binding protein [Nitrospirae bacterium CG_4_10_14_3_um_filter
MIKIVELSKSFGENHVLQGVDLEIKEGESMVVIGGSGSGKSVLIKHIIGILRPDTGRIYVAGEDIAQVSEHELNQVRKKFGMLFQAAALFDSLSVWENVGFGLKQHTRLSNKEIREKAREKLAMVGLYDVEDLRPSELSGGMQKRVGLARAIAMEPQILLYDEPTTGLDPINADMINNLIIDMREKLNVTSVAITHDMVSAYKIADRIAMLYRGKILQIGAPSEIQATENPYVRQFIAGSAVGPITEDLEKELMERSAK